MTYAYPRSTGASSLPSLAPGKKPPNVLSRAWYRVSPLAKEWITDGNAAYGFGKGRDKNDIQTSPLRILRRVFTVTNAIILLWIFTLWWGERSVFQDSLEACAWEKWEKWVSRQRTLSILVQFNRSHDFGSLKLRRPIMSLSLPTLSSLIPIPTLVARGLSRR